MHVVNHMCRISARKGRGLYIVHVPRMDIVKHSWRGSRNLCRNTMVKLHVWQVELSSVNTVSGEDHSVVWSTQGGGFKDNSAS